MKSWSGFVRQALVGGLFISGILQAQAPLVDYLGRPAWVSAPRYLLPAYEDEADSTLRTLRSDHFNSPQSQAKFIGDITEPGHQVNTGSSFVSSSPDSMPTQLSDVIVVGSLVSHQPFLSSDHTRIYSELKLVPTEVLADKHSRLQGLSALTLLQEGGSVKLETGQVVRTAPPGGSSPLKLSTPYLVFLRYLPSEQAYTLLKAWELSSEQPRPVMGDGHAADATSMSSAPTDRNSLLIAVKRKVSEDR